VYDYNEDQKNWTKWKLDLHISKSEPLLQLDSLDFSPFHSGS